VLRRIFGSDKRTVLSYFRGNDPELDQLLRAGSEALDPAKRITVYAQAQRLIIDKVYAIPTYVLSYSIAAANNVQGVAVDAHGFPVFSDAWLQ
jgi:peptide/nickel transport system substrate-binding protein